VFTAFLGYIASSISEWLRDRRASERERATAEATSIREREAREATRQVQLFERRANFQRETLLNLQDAVVKLTRTAGRMHHIDEMEHRKTGKWGGFSFPEGLSDDALQAGVAIMVLTSRVRDEQIREMVKTFKSNANRIGISPNEQATRKALEGMIEVLEPLHERIGEILRKLDDDEDAQPVTTT